MIRYFLIAMMVFTNIAHSQETQPANVGPISRTAIVVRDLDRALLLFRDILGLKVLSESPIMGDLISEHMGHDVKLEGSILGLGTGESRAGNIVLMHYTNIDKGHEEDHAAKFDVGNVALVMMVDPNVADIYEIYKKVKAAGFKIISAPAELYPRPGLKEQAVDMFFIGPEGVVIELIKPSIK